MMIMYIMSDYKQENRICRKKTVHYGDGHTEEVQGIKVEDNITKCYYGEVQDSYENNEQNCTNRGHNWARSLSKCFVDMDYSYTAECPLGYQFNGYLYRNDIEYKAGCYKKVDKEVTCRDDFVLTNGYCVKTIDATLEK